MVVNGAVMVSGAGVAEGRVVRVGGLVHASVIHGHARVVHARVVHGMVPVRGGPVRMDIRTGGAVIWQLMVRDCQRQVG
jgi:hypothetical protein